MTTTEPTTQKPVTDDTLWYTLSAEEALSRLGVEAGAGLSAREVADRLATYGRNEVATEPPPTTWQMARAQIANPMNIMLLIVSIAAFAIDQLATGAIVLVLVLFNVVMGTNQERKAMASVDALAELQVPTARVRRDGTVEEVDAVGLVPGDVLLVEAGDLVPSNLVFQNTQVTRGSAELVVVATGQSTQMGQIADMVSATKRVRSPLQIELDGLTKIFGFVAWAAIAVIAIVGIARDQDGETLVLLCVSTAISAIPTGLPTFVQAMLSSGAQRLAESKAVVKSLNDVETLGGTTVINSDKTGTLTMNAMTSVTMLTGGSWYKIEGAGYATSGAILGPAGEPTPDFTGLALGLALCSDATVADDESIIGDPTEAALVVLAAKIGVDAEETRRTIPRIALVPFDSEYKFMATFHDRPSHMDLRLLTEPHFMSVKGAPDVVIDRCSEALWHGEVVPMDRVK
jgi:Ca2+-transporting ATPase